MMPMRYVREQPPPPPHPSMLPKGPGNHFQDGASSFAHSKKGSSLRSDEITAETREAEEEYLKASKVLDATQPKTFELKENVRQLYECLRNTHPADAEPVPQWLSLHDKVLRFFAWISEPVDGTEKEIIRKVVISYFPVDETMTIVEPRVQNSGLVGGVMLKRHKVPRCPKVQQWREAELQEKLEQPEKFMTIDDFNVGKDVDIYARTYHIVDADQATREFLADLGIYTPEPLPYPEDPFMATRATVDTFVGQRAVTFADMDLKRTFEQSVKGRSLLKFPSEIRKTQKFLVDNGTVLCFKAVWDDRENPHGDVRFFQVRYYLADDTVEVIEKLKSNAGRDPTRAFAYRRRLPKDKATDEITYNLTFQARVNGGIPESDAYKYYNPPDLAIGGYVNVYGRSLLLVDCDPFTREYYANTLGIQLGDAIDVDARFGLPKTRPNLTKPPPHNGYGTEEDSLGNWKNLVLRPPKYDLGKFLMSGTCLLRFSMKFYEPHTAEDVGREFVLTFYMGDDTLQVVEQPGRNSGIIGGTFLKKQRVKKFQGEGPLCFFAWNDFYVGAIININGHRFIVTGMDEYTRRFRYNRQNLPSEVTGENVRAHIEKLQMPKPFDELTIQECLRKMEDLGMYPPSAGSDDLTTMIIQLLDQFKKDHNETAKVVDLIKVLDGVPLLPGEDASRKEASPEQVQALLVLQRFREGIRVRGLSLSDAFRIISASASSKSQAGGKITNLVTNTLNAYQVAQACGDMLRLGFTDTEIDLLIRAFFVVDRTKVIGLHEFLTVINRAEMNIPPPLGL